MKTALISCWNKQGLTGLCRWLFQNNYKVISTGGTYAHIASDHREAEAAKTLLKVDQVTEFPEILGGRVKTLHPAIHGGLLAKRSDSTHMDELSRYQIDPIDLVVVNLYPFWQVTPDVLHSEAIELIDIGGVALARAAAKNSESIAVLTDPGQYDEFIRIYGATDTNTEHFSANQGFRSELAAKAFRMTSQYDEQIASFFERQTNQAVALTREYKPVMSLRYGCNPHQHSAAVYSVNGGSVPFQILNGDCSYINILDAMGCMGLVEELEQTTGGRVAACSFKHTSPAGAAIAMDWNSLITESQTQLRLLYGIDETASPALNAYVRARNGDPLCSFGDFIGISATVDATLARVIRGHVSDGIIAPDYTPEALDILKQKKKGKYVVLRYDKDNSTTAAATPEVEFREIGGIAVSQQRNIQQITDADLTPEKIVTAKFISQRVSKTQPKLDLVVANAALKFAQSNNVACAYQGQIIGLSAGQQSRVHSVRLACHKARVWINRHSATSLSLVHSLSNEPFQEKINKTTAIAEEAVSLESDVVQGIVLASDAFFPFPDSITEANKVGVRFISQPGGSLRDKEVIEECDRHGIVMYFTGKRIFTH